MKRLFASAILVGLVSVTAVAQSPVQTMSGYLVDSVFGSTGLYRKNCFSDGGDGVCIDVR